MSSVFISNWSTFEGYQNARLPVKIRNITKKPNFKTPEIMDIIVNKRSKLEEGKSNELDFDFIEKEKEDEKEIVVADIEDIDSETLITIKGRMSIDKNETKEFQRDGNTVQLVEAGAITDHTGSTRITVWADMIDKVNDGQAYSFSGLRVKEYNGLKFLATTFITQIENIEEDYPVPDININCIKEVTVQKIEMVENFSVWYACRKCNRQLTQLSTIATVKCNDCRALMRLSKCSKAGSIRIAIEDHEELVWLTAFDKEMKILFDATGNDNITINSNEDSVCDALLGLTKPCTIKYNENTFIIESITF